jgi:hypothetical protein
MNDWLVLTNINKWYLSINENINIYKDRLICLSQNIFLVEILKVQNGTSQGGNSLMTK